VGDSPATVIVSARAATRICWFTVLTPATRTGMPDRSVAAKPDSSNFNR
jgi:hypothetical protein